MSSHHVYFYRNLVMKFKALASRIDAREFVELDNSVKLLVSKLVLEANDRKSSMDIQHFTNSRQEIHRVDN